MTACFLSVHLNVVVSLKEIALGSKRHQDLYKKLKDPSHSLELGATRGKNYKGHYMIHVFSQRLCNLELITGLDKSGL